MLKNLTRRSTRQGVQAVVAAAAIVATVFVAPSAHAADPSTKFRLEYGASYAYGTLRWHQRSVDVDVTLHASYCRQLKAYPFDRNGVGHQPGWTPRVCNGTISGTISLPVNVPGGAAIVRLDLVDETGKLLVSKPCRPSANCDK
ncbi:hypothetical protein [Lentzea flaviverrucosa]|uniref:Peptidase inhibitor family I36 n=1 Tax=Lentzea flaviverrucosa TaxID=200379 RepID=A0A1H9BYB1_9PSEU|nr:hypothetical protein [Lentzea flaviverrucosa]RDI31636.1 hypothetical protein DFR72_10328 [Lentzea flaviverrucosa]SEP93844.1 hypothetical protein SAMN05216195_101629 [Lentzea flaviverrucosa]